MNAGKTQEVQEMHHLGSHARVRIPCAPRLEPHARMRFSTVPWLKPRQGAVFHRALA